ncbi:hypothetical protein EJ110_NYTH07113 [Nymphaea thermarum]|nr:hypothetical protein EJ110_NYTH07113 [Nymphaea thermarum]
MRVQDSRLIALCNSIVKIISKVIVARLQNILVFIKNRVIDDHVALANDVVDVLSSKKEESSCLKLYISKAYDRVSWSFLANSMHACLGFPNCWISLTTMKCVTSPTFSMLVNGVEGMTFKSGRSLRQCDRLSSCLFLIVMEMVDGMNGGIAEKEISLTNCVKNLPRCRSCLINRNFGLSLFLKPPSSSWKAAFLWADSPWERRSCYNLTKTILEDGIGLKRIDEINSAKEILELGPTVCGLEMREGRALGPGIVYPQAGRKADVMLKCKVVSGMMLAHSVEETWRSRVSYLKFVKAGLHSPQEP